MFVAEPLLWNGVNDLRVETVPDPELVNPHDIILWVTASTTCGSDLHLSDDQALFMSDAGPTGYMGADFCAFKGGETVAVWGAGGVGLMAMQSARLLGAERVIAIGRFPERLQLARQHAGAERVRHVQAQDGWMRADGVSPLST